MSKKGEKRGDLSVIDQCDIYFKCGSFYFTTLVNQVARDFGFTSEHSEVHKEIVKF